VKAVAGTSAKAYCTFIEHVLDMYNAIEDPVLPRTLIHNNLLSHKAPEVYKAMDERTSCCLSPTVPATGWAGQICYQSGVSRA
jgi:hypothetical protein